MGQRSLTVKVLYQALAGLYHPRTLVQKRRKKFINVQLFAIGEHAHLPLTTDFIKTPDTQPLSQKIISEQEAR